MSRAVLCLFVVVAVCALAEGSFKHRLQKDFAKIKHAAVKGAAVGAATLGATVGVVKGVSGVVGDEVKHAAHNAKKTIVTKVNHGRQHVADGIAPNHHY